MSGILAAIKEAATTAAKEIGKNVADGLNRKIEGMGPDSGKLMDRAHTTFKAEDFEGQKVKDVTDAPKKDVRDTVPSGHDGINKEGRTIEEICEKPLTEECEQELCDLMKDEGLPPEKIDEVIDYIKGIQPKDIPQDGTQLSNYDINGNGCSVPGKEAYEKYAKEHPNLSPAEVIRAVNYDAYRQYLADKLGISKELAGKLIGKADMVIHEDASGRMMLIPNNIHRYTEVYYHKGYVAQVKGKLVESQD